MEHSNEVVLEFLDLYEQEPVIWRSKYPNHKNRKAVNDAWKRIAEKISVECSITDLKRKKESLMSTFRPLLNKVKTTSGASKVFKPTWFAYEKMESFLHGIYKPRTAENTEEIKSSSLQTTFEDIPDKTKVESIETKVEPVETKSSEKEPSRTDIVLGIRSNKIKVGENLKASTNKQKSKKGRSDPLEASIEQAYKMLKTSVNIDKPKNNQCSLFGLLIAQKLEALDEVTRVIVMNEIDNMLFRATIKQMGQRQLPLSANRFQTLHSNNVPISSSSPQYPFFNPTSPSSSGLSSPSHSCHSELSSDLMFISPSHLTNPTTTTQPTTSGFSSTTST